MWITSVLTTTEMVEAAVIEGVVGVVVGGVVEVVIEVVAESEIHSACEISWKSFLSCVTMLTESLRYAVLKTRRLQKKKQMITLR